MIDIGRQRKEADETIAATIWKEDELEVNQKAVVQKQFAAEQKMHIIDDSDAEDERTRTRSRSRSRSPPTIIEKQPQILKRMIYHQQMLKQEQNIPELYHRTHEHGRKRVTEDIMTKSGMIEDKDCFLPATMDDGQSFIWENSEDEVKNMIEEGSVVRALLGPTISTVLSNISDRIEDKMPDFVITPTKRRQRIRNKAEKKQLDLSMFDEKNE
jgi:cellobiose-specific phosphotransferase system component IIB